MTRWLTIVLALAVQFVIFPPLAGSNTSVCDCGDPAVSTACCCPPVADGESGCVACGEDSEDSHSPELAYVEGRVSMPVPAVSEHPGFLGARWAPANGSRPTMTKAPPRAPPKVGERLALLQVRRT